MSATEAASVPKLAYSIREVAAALSVSPDWVRLRIDDGTIESVKIVGRRLVRHDVLERLLAGSAA